MTFVMQPSTVTTASGKPQAHLGFSQASDLANLPLLDAVAAGSDAYNIQTQDVYILDPETNTWIMQ